MKWGNSESKPSCESILLWPAILDTETIFQRPWSSSPVLNYPQIQQCFFVQCHVQVAIRYVAISTVYAFCWYLRFCIRSHQHTSLHGTGPVSRYPHTRLSCIWKSSYFLLPWRTSEINTMLLLDSPTTWVMQRHLHTPNHSVGNCRYLQLKNVL